VAEAVLVPTEDAEIRLALDCLDEPPAERAVHRAARLVVVGEQERKIDEAQLGHAVGEIARRLIAERQNAALDQPQDFLGLVAEIHDVPAILDVDAIAELLFQAVADKFHRLAEAGGRRAVAAHADLNRIGHGRAFYFMFSASQSAAKSMPTWRLSTWACSAPPSSVVKILIVLFFEPTAS